MIVLAPDFQNEPFCGDVLRLGPSFLSFFEDDDGREKGSVNKEKD